MHFLTMTRCYLVDIQAIAPPPPLSTSNRKRTQVCCISLNALITTMHLKRVHADK